MSVKINGVEDQLKFEVTSRIDSIPRSEAVEISEDKSDWAV